MLTITLMLAGFVVVFVEGQLPIEELCPKKFRQRDVRHTACLQPPQGDKRPTKEGVTEASQKYIVNLHNYYRKNVHKFGGHPSATNMQKMYWDDELAMIAQKWASHCYYDHDESGLRAVPGSYGVGQNIGRGHRGWGHLIKNWQSEFKDFKFGEGKTSGGPIGHYTQMVWAETARIGCGYARCNRTQAYYVCNYAPAGNMRNSRYEPYNSGPKNASCPNSARSGLCDCGGKVCLNGGTLNLDTCQCECLNKPWIRQNANCALDCSGAEDSFACASQGGRWGLDACARYVNVPSEYCPITCQLCPERTEATTPVLLPSITKPARWPDAGWIDGILKTSTNSPSQPIFGNTGKTEIMNHNNAEQTTPVIVPDGQDKTTRAQVETTTITTTRRPVTTRVITTTRQRATTTQPTTPPVTADTCASADNAMCGQPSSTGYYNPMYCMFYQKSLCPGMCGHCQARECVDYENRKYPVGQSWMNEYGEITCTTSGVKVKRGCYISAAKHVIPPGQKHSYVDGYTSWTCTCSLQYSMSCQGITRRWTRQG